MKSNKPIFLRLEILILILIGTLFAQESGIHRAHPDALNHGRKTPTQTFTIKPAKPKSMLEKKQPQKAASPKAVTNKYDNLDLSIIQRSCCGGSNITLESLYRATELIDNQNIDFPDREIRKKAIGQAAFFIENLDMYNRYIENGQEKSMDKAFALYLTLLDAKDQLSSIGIDLREIDMSNLLLPEMVARYQKTDIYKAREKVNDNYADDFNFNRPIGRKSKHDDRFSDTGIFGRFSPNDEILEKRTPLSKKFRIDDEHVSSIIGGPFHYEDEFGAMQDIDLTIRSRHDDGYPFYNKENRFESNFSSNAIDGVELNYRGHALKYGIEPILFADDFIPIASGTAIASDSVMQYDNVLDGAKLEYIINRGHIKHWFTIDDREFFDGLRADKVYLRERFRIPDGAVLQDSLGEFSAKREIDGIAYISVDGEPLFGFDPPRAWDSSFEGDARFHPVGENIIEPIATIKPLGEGEYEYALSVPSDWLIAEEREYPVIIDPTVTVPPGSTYPGYAYPWATEVFYVRACQYIYHSSDIGYSGDIQSIAFNQSASNSMMNDDVWVKMKHTYDTDHDYPNVFETGLSDCNTTSYYYWTSGTGWRTMYFGSDFSYSTSYNLLAETHQYLNSVTSYGTGGGWYYIADAGYYGHRWGTRSVSGNVWPLDPYDSYTDINFGSNVAVAQLDIYIAPSEHCYTPTSYDYGTYYPSTSWTTHDSDFDATGCRVYRFYLYYDREYDFSCCSSDGVGGSASVGDADFRMYNSSGTEQWYYDGPSSCSYDATTLGSTYEGWSPPSTGYYYLRVEEYGDNACDYTLAYKYSDSAPTDHCYDCPDYDYSRSISTTWQTHSGSFESSYCRMYRFYLYSGTPYEFTTGCGEGSADFDTYLELYNASCSSVASNDDACSSLQSQIEYTPSSSGYYYLKVRGYESASGSYTLAYREQTGSCVSCPSYDHGTYYPGTSWNTHSDDFISEGCRLYRFYLYSGNDYSFTTGCDGGSSADFDTRLYLYNSGCSEVAYNDDACGLQSQIDYTPSSAGYYYLKVDGYGGAGGSYTLAYRYQVPCETPGTPTTYSPSSITEDGAYLSWAAGSPAGDPTVTYYWAVGTSSGVTYESGYTERGTTTGTSVTVSGLSPDTDYYFNVKACTSCDGSCSSYGTSRYFHTLAAEHCYTCGTTDYGTYTPTTAWSTHSSSVGSGGPSSACRWYGFSVTSGRSYTFTMCDGGGSYTGDTEMWLYNSSCGIETSNDDYCGLGSQITWLADYTGMVYLKVASHNTNAATWTLAWQYAEGCSAPTSVTAYTPSTDVCAGEDAYLEYSSHSGGICSGEWQYEWRNGSGTPVRSWSTTADYTMTSPSSGTYYLYMRCSDCTADVSPASNDITITVYNDEPLGTWTGYEDTDWDNPNNWALCESPTVSTDVTIPNIPTYGRFPTINTTTGSCQARTVINNGTIDGGSGLLELQGDWINNGVFNRGTSTIELDGTYDQTLEGTGATSFYNIRVPKTSATIYLGRDITVYGRLNMLYPRSNLWNMNSFDIHYRSD